VSGHEISRLQQSGVYCARYTRTIYSRQRCNLYVCLGVYVQGHRFKKIVLSIYLVVVIILGIIMVLAVAAG